MNAKISPDIAFLLEEEARRINNPAFIADDPVQFPRRFSDQRDCEIVALLVSTIAWGNRVAICRDAEKLLQIMNFEPYLFMMQEAYEELDPERNIHRTFFASHLQHWLRGLRSVYSKHPTLDAFAACHEIGKTEAPAWELARLLNAALADANNGVSQSRCLPQNLDSSALKRLNMALRWMVRDDGIVDLGLWKSIPKSKLFLPLDVHVGNTSRALGLLQRKSNDRKAVEELTQLLRTLNPDDPCLFDFALFGIGIEARRKMDKSASSLGKNL